MLGSELLAWILHVEPSALDDLAEEVRDSESYAGVLYVVEGALAASRETSAPTALSLRPLSTWVEPFGTTLANALRLLRGGDLPTADAHDEIARQLQQLARDAAPMMLIPVERPWGLSLPSLTMFGHPLAADFEAAVRNDVVLSRVFAEESPNVGVAGYTRRSTGVAGSTQLAMFAASLIGTTADYLRFEDRLTPESLVSEVPRALARVRAGIEQVGTVRTHKGYANVLLPPARTLTTPWGTLRAATPYELDLGLPGLEGALDSPDTDGTTQIRTHYIGDVVLVREIPYLVQYERAAADNVVTGDPFRDFKAAWERDAHDGLLLQTAFTLGVRRDGHESALIPTWTVAFDPLSTGVSPSWRSKRHTSDPLPMKLTYEEIDEIERLAARLGTIDCTRIDIALRRLQSALWERSDPGDRLVDGVIVWENLFGTGEGEVTLRISTAIAWLLEPNDPARRQALQKQLGTLYKHRSAVVHGSPEVKKYDLDADARAVVQFGVAVLRKLVIDRPELISLSDRGQRLLLGA